MAQILALWFAADNMTFFSTAKGRSNVSQLTECLTWASFLNSYPSGGHLPTGRQVEQAEIRLLLGSAGSPSKGEEEGG